MSKTNDNDLTEKLVGDQPIQHNPYIYDPQQLAKICHTDNHHKAEDSQYPDMIKSSQMIHKLGGIDEILSKLQSDRKVGIKEDTIEERRRIYGENAFAPPHIKTLKELILENFDDPINIVLLMAAVVSMIIGIINHPHDPLEGMIEGTSICVALVIIISVNSANNYASEQRLANLLKTAEKLEVAVYRGKEAEITIDSSELVVGDIIKIENGKKLPADCLMIEGQDVKCVEAALTGEPDEIKKDPITKDNYTTGALCTLLAKATVNSGMGKALVIAVGSNSLAGGITAATQEKDEDQRTELQKKLETMAEKIGYLGMAVAVMTFVAQIIRLVLEMYKVLPCGCENFFSCGPITGCKSEDVDLVTKGLSAIIISITVVVVAIPEGLPLSVTISLSFSQAQMQKLNNLVRKLSASETMGQVTHICSDKTGTLTENKMTVMAMECYENLMSAGTSISDKLVKETSAFAKNVNIKGQDGWSTIVESVLWNASAWLEENDGKDPNIKDKFVTKGNVTEQGIIKFFMGELGAEGCIKKMNELTDDNTLCIIPFTSTRKMGSIVVKRPNRQGQQDEVRVYCKGAPDFVLKNTTNAVNKDAQVVDIESQVQVPAALNNDGGASRDSHRGVYERTIKNFAKQAYRTILTTFRDMSMQEFNSLKSQNNNFEKDEDRLCLEQNLTAIGIFGLQDPLRPTIIDSVKILKKAGIKVIMCTGDNIDTATAISLNAGIVSQDDINAAESDKENGKKKYVCMTGEDFRKTVGGLTQDILRDPKTGEVILDEKTNKPKLGEKRVANMKAFKEVISDLCVLARSSPDDKYLLVTGIQENGKIVAVTGDGTNDAPALTKANVGFSMGITGTDVAKGASDIILLDDNFSSTIVALRFGRNVYDNIRKFLQFQLTVNVVAMFIVFFGAVVTTETPLNAVQMLWVNLIMDTFAALALATEAPPDDILDRQPQPKTEAIITAVMWRNILTHAIYQIIVLVVLVLGGQSLGIVHTYDQQCVKFNVAHDGCETKGFNPFFERNFYYDYNKTWQPLVEDKTFNFGLESFDEQTLNAFILESKKELHDDTVVITGPFDAILKQIPTQKTILFTHVFQTFVFMQVFNQFNARLLIDGQFNIFKSLHKNPIFIVITILTFIIQIGMVEYGGKIVKCHPLDWNQNLVCFAIASGELIWGILIKFIPLSIFAKLQMDEKPKAAGEAPSLIRQITRKSDSAKRGSKVL